MIFDRPLIRATLIRRYKRFLADVELETGETITVHCPNSGSMKTCMTPGWPAMLSDSENPKRKYRYTWEMVHNGHCWIGINTHLANKIVAEGIGTGQIPELAGYDSLRTEVKYGQNSRIDILLESEAEKCFVEVKNVTLVEADGFYKFPDAVTVRGRKHLYELQDQVARGHRAVMLYLIQRNDGTVFKPAADIDPDYAASLREVHASGVEILPYLSDVQPTGIRVTERVDFAL